MSGAVEAALVPPEEVSTAQVISLLLTYHYCSQVLIYSLPGLTQYSVCQAVGKTIPRTAQTQYSSSMGRHMPRADAQAGDMIFWATNGDCAGSVAHVGIFMKPGWMVNAAHTGTPVREQAIWTSSGGESICPDAVR